MDTLLTYPPLQQHELKGEFEGQSIKTKRYPDNYIYCPRISLLADKKIRTKVLLGTDFYMVEMEDFLEKQLSIFLRATIGEAFFKEIAETNPKRYLYGEKK